MRQTVSRSGSVVERSSEDSFSSNGVLSKRAIVGVVKRILHPIHLL
jgi:hypothetical protein